jgi:hypothetical protein
MHRTSSLMTRVVEALFIEPSHALRFDTHVRSTMSSEPEFCPLKAHQLSGDCRRRRSPTCREPTFDGRMCIFEELLLAARKQMTNSYSVTQSFSGDVLQPFPKFQADGLRQ